MKSIGGRLSFHIVKWSVNSHLSGIPDIRFSVATLIIWNTIFLRFVGLPSTMFKSAWKSGYSLALITLNNKSYILYYFKMAFFYQICFNLFFYCTLSKLTMELDGLTKRKHNKLILYWAEGWLPNGPIQFYDSMIWT